MGDVPDVGHKCGGREVGGFPVLGTGGVVLLMVDANTLSAAFNVVSALVDCLEVRSTTDELTESMPDRTIGVRRKDGAVSVLSETVKVFEFYAFFAWSQSCHAPGKGNCHISGFTALRELSFTTPWILSS